LEQYPKDADNAKDISGAFHQAAPGLAGAAEGSEFHVLTLPAGPSVEKFAEHARQAMKDIDLAVAAGIDDILFYRENPNLALKNLPQLGPKFQQAYQEMSAQQDFTPHSREDITQW